MDREKVIEGLEAIREFFGFGLPIQTPVFEAYQNILTDALALLKEQEDEIAKFCGEVARLTALLEEQEEHEKLLTKIGYHWTGSGETLALCRMKVGERE